MSYHAQLFSLTSLPTTRRSMSASSSILTSSASSRSTIPGLGELSGKAIRALGKVTIRGAEYLIIRRRLNAIASNFPHTDAENIGGITEMYEDLLELSRQDAYTDSIRNRAIRMLLRQIGSRQTHHLRNTLSQWSATDIEIFVSELVTIFDPIRLLSGEAASDTLGLIKAYKNTHATWEIHSIVPLINFLNDMAQSQSLAFSILQGGAMDFLFKLYATGFRDPLGDPGILLQDACKYFLSTLLGRETELRVIQDHPLFMVWQTGYLDLPLINGNFNREALRIQVWNLCKRPIVSWRLTSIFDSLESWSIVADTPSAYDTYVDVLELSASESIDLDISYRALRAWLRYNARGYALSQKCLRRYLASSPTEYFVRIMTRVIIRLAHVISTETPESRLFFVPWDADNTKATAALHFICYFLDIAKKDETFLSVAIAANILGLLRPFLEIELCGHTNMARHDGDLMTHYDAPDFDLLAMIKKRGLRDILPKLSEDTYITSYRRNVLCQSFDVFLRRGDPQQYLDIPRLDWNDPFWMYDPKANSLLRGLPLAVEQMGSE